MLSRQGWVALLTIILAACALSIIVAPGREGLIASSVMLACWLVLLASGLWQRRRGRA